MLTECDMLSRYNNATSKWYDNDISSTRTSVHQMISPSAIMFPDKILEDNPRLQAIHRLPKQNSQGNPYWPRSKEMNDLLIQRNLLVENVIGLPIQEALIEIGLITHCKIIGTEPFPITPSITSFQILDTDSFYASLDNTIQKKNVD